MYFIRKFIEKSKSLFENIFFLKTNLFLVFSIFAALFKRSGLYQAFGFTKTQPILMGLLIIFQFVLSPYFEVKNKTFFFF